VSRNQSHSGIREDLKHTTRWVKNPGSILDAVLMEPLSDDEKRLVGRANYAAMTRDFDAALAMLEDLLKTVESQIKVQVLKGVEAQIWLQKEGKSSEQARKALQE
jgi:hypothetical protein